MNKVLLVVSVFLVLCMCSNKLRAQGLLQNTQIRGFIDGITTYQKGKTSFGFEEQDLFITSQLTNRLSFLGESVFKFDNTSSTDFSVSIERVVFKYNYYGNNSFVFGKIHTPINYWNDSYHHGRVFYPTIYRPKLFDANIIPLHTTGADLQGQNLGRLKFGYDVIVGNGLGSEDVSDNDKYKSLTLNAYIRPADGLRIGASYYHDIISKGAIPHGSTLPVDYKITQDLATGSVAYFGPRFELLAESTWAFNRADAIGTRRTSASYVYGGVRVLDKLVPYVRVDRIQYQNGEMYYHKDNTTALVGGLRYEISYLAVLKLEYERDDREIEKRTNTITAQIAIGF